MIDHQQFTVDDQIFLPLVFFVSIYGIHLALKNWFYTLGGLLLYILVVGFSESWWIGLIAGVVAVILAEVAYSIKSVSTKLRERDSSECLHEYVFHLLIVPVIVWLLPEIIVPETNYPVGIILAALLWGFVWQLSWNIDFYDRGTQYFLVWGFVIVLVFLLSFILYQVLHGTWIAIAITTVISLILYYLIY